MCVFWLISSYSNRSLLQQQADGLGQALAEQTAMQLTELVLANDLISVNVVLNSLTEATGIQRISVLSVDDAVLAEAEGREEAIRPLVPLPVPLHPFAQNMKHRLRSTTRLRGPCGLSLTSTISRQGQRTVFC